MQAVTSVTLIDEKEMQAFVRNFFQIGSQYTQAIDDMCLLLDHKRREYENIIASMVRGEVVKVGKERKIIEGTLAK